MEFCRTEPCSVNNRPPACAIWVCCQGKEREDCRVCSEYLKCPHIAAMLLRHSDMQYSLKRLRLHRTEGFAAVRGKK